MEERTEYRIYGNTLQGISSPDSGTLAGSLFGVPPTEGNRGGQVTSGKIKPRLLYSDDEGVIRDHPGLLALGDGGGDPQPLVEVRTIPLPRGSDLFMLPGRAPLGRDPASGETIVLQTDPNGRRVHGVAAFLAPAHTTSRLACFRARPAAPALPRYSYAAVGFTRGRYWVAGRRVDREIRQDPWRFDPAQIRQNVDQLLSAEPANRLLQQLERCALEYHCRAAQNFFLGRHEAPLPVSVACNARCLGCISLQPDGSFKAAHDRLAVPPDAQEVAAVACAHIRRVTPAVVSFGQGCEGEPLLRGAVLADSIRLIRRETSAGTINLNTNASLPDVVAELADQGLDSMRVSLNSTRPDLYTLYYRPQGYCWEDVVQSMREMRRRDRFVSLNLLYFPGVTDRPAEIESLGALIANVGIGMIQLRNLNIDPELYMNALPPGVRGPGVGLTAFMKTLRLESPRLRFGTFNPPKEQYRLV